MHICSHFTLIGLFMMAANQQRLDANDLLKLKKLLFSPIKKLCGTHLHQKEFPDNYCINVPVKFFETMATYEFDT